MTTGAEHWERWAERWSAWARRGDDSYWLETRDAFAKLLPPPGPRS